MGYAPVIADTVDSDFVRETCPAEWETFVKAIDENGETLESIAQLQRFGDDSPVDKELGLLIEAFNKKTDLTLFLNYHDSSDEGDRYDDINGAFWEVDGVWQMTPAAEKLRDKIRREGYVIFG